jgi:hypothetical protein
VATVLGLLRFHASSIPRRTFVPRGLSLFEDEEVILAVGLGEVVAGDLAEAGALDLGSDDGLIEAMVGAVAVAVNDAEAGAGLERRAQVGEDELGAGDLVVDLQHQGSVEGVGLELRVVGRAYERFDIGKVLALGTLLDVGDGFGVDGLGDDAAIGADAAGGADTEPAAAGTDVGDGAAGFELQEVHDVVDLEALVATRLLEGSEVAGVGRAGGMRGRSGVLRPKVWREDDGNGEEGGERQESQISEYSTVRHNYLWRVSRQGK